MNYLCLKNDKYCRDDYCIVPLRFQDIMLIKKWRNDQISVLRQDRVLTDEDQDNYYQNIVLPAMAAVKPSIILFSYLVDGACIGYGGLTNIDWTSKKGEISFLLDSVRISDAERYRLDFGVFLKLIERIAFEEVHLNR